MRRWKANVFYSPPAALAGTTVVLNLLHMDVTREVALLGQTISDRWGWSSKENYDVVTFAAFFGRHLGYGTVHVWLSIQFFLRRPG